MNSLRKRPTYDDLIHYLNNQPTINYPARKAIRLINDPFVSNLLFDDDLPDDMMIEKRNQVQREEANQMMQMEQSTQTPYERGTQTEESLDKGTQKDFLFGEDDDEEYERNPHLYRKIDATSKWKKHHWNTYWWFKPTEQNDATSSIIDTEDNQIKDSASQTSRYIPGSLKKKSDNINQTVRYELKRLVIPVPTPTEVSEAEQPSEHPSEPSYQPSIASSGGKKKGYTPEPTPEPSPVPTPKPTPPQSEYEEDDLDEEDRYMRDYGYMAWVEKYYNKY